MSDTDAPIRIEVWRGSVVESEHLVDAVFADASGSIVRRWGDAGRGVIPRSAIKAVQALPLITTGAAAAFDVSDDELALACSSHSGEPGHIDAVESWLDRVGAGPGQLECGPDRPIDDDAAAALIRAGVDRAPVHNCCSGKHSGFITTAQHLGEQVAGYLAPTSAVQSRVQDAIKTMTDIDLSGQEPGIDGCGIPVYEFPLTSLAMAMARLVDRTSLDASLSEAAAQTAAALPTRCLLYTSPSPRDS